jgi:ATP-dependent RNA helicase DOB1
MDLFSFLDENDVETNSQLPTNVPHKRKQTSEPIHVDFTGQDSQVAWRGSSKKPRLSSPHPIVLDDFETEAKREIEASAGLTGTAEVGARLELRHQVSYSICPEDSTSSEICFLGSTSGGRSTWL